MSITSVREWTNETGLTTYPLVGNLITTTKKVFPKDFLVDANFVQYDGFIPSITSVTVTDATITIVLNCDEGATSVAYTKAEFEAATRSVRVYLDGRYIGRLVFGDGTAFVFADFRDETMTKPVAFLPVVVRNIPLASGVFSVDGLSGVVAVQSSDDTMFFNVASQVVTLNAVYVPPAVTSVLKTLNLRPPTDNNIILSSTEIIKIGARGTDTVTVELIDPTISNLLPSKV